MDNDNDKSMENELKEICQNDLRHELRKARLTLFLLEVLLTLLVVGSAAINTALLIQMLVEHKFVFWKAVSHIFWATTFLGIWFGHNARRW